MDRAEFLNRLEAQLLDVPQAEREEALQYYEDYLNDAGDAGDFDILQEPVSYTHLTLPTT